VETGLNARAYCLKFSGCDVFAHLVQKLSKHFELGNIELTCSKIGRTHRSYKNTAAKSFPTNGHVLGSGSLDGYFRVYSCVKEVTTVPCRFKVGQHNNILIRCRILFEFKMLIIFFETWPTAHLDQATILCTHKLMTSPHARHVIGQYTSGRWKTRERLERDEKVTNKKYWKIFRRNLDFSYFPCFQFHNEEVKSYLSPSFLIYSVYSIFPPKIFPRRNLTIHNKLYPFYTYVQF
jgi:hypothetical protein